MLRYGSLPAVDCIWRDGEANKEGERVRQREGKEGAHGDTFTTIKTMVPVCCGLAVQGLGGGELRRCGMVRLPHSRRPEKHTVQPQPRLFFGQPEEANPKPKRA